MLIRRKAKNPQEAEHARAFMACAQTQCEHHAKLGGPPPNQSGQFAPRPLMQAGFERRAVPVLAALRVSADLCETQRKLESARMKGFQQ